MSLRTASFALQVLVSPFVLLGIAMVMTIIGIPVAAAIFLGIWLGWRRARQVRRSPEDPAAVARFRDLAVLMAIPLGIALAVGHDDVSEKPENMAGLAVALAWVGFAVVVALIANSALRHQNLVAR